MQQRSLGASARPLPHNKFGALRIGFAMLIVLLGVIFIFNVVDGHASATSSLIHSGISGYCLDDYKNKPTVNNMVSAWPCNGSAAQAWTVTDASITHNASSCLGVAGNATTSGSTVVAAPCAQTAGQIWLRDKTGYYNPNSGLCLASPNGAGRSQLVLDSCQKLSQPGETWIPSQQSYASTCPHNSEGEAVSCYAMQEWGRWQSGSLDHNALLNTYTDGSSYEAWCADFVSYVYKEAGYPLVSAYDGWDENNANNLQNYSFTKHLATSGYIPKAGDIAYFDYSSGHVEMVVSGGKTPTFIYGNSATIDPVTGNGQMEANTIISDGSLGRLVYYLSPG